ncbi:hypothetical protein QQ045_017171 [Rhodiola kirilowii]
MAAPSRMMLKSSSATLSLFTKSKSILNRLPPCASAVVLTSPEAGSSRLIDQLAASRLNSDETRLRFLNGQLLPIWFTRSGSADEEMLMARGPRQVVESEDDGSETDEDDGSEDIEDFDVDDSDEEPDDGESEEDEPWKKVRTRSRRDD